MEEHFFYMIQNQVGIKKIWLLNEDPMFTTKKSISVRSVSLRQQIDDLFRTA